MSSADHSERRAAKLLSLDATGRVREVPRTELASLFMPGDLVIANDAATLPASLCGMHERSGEPIEIRLAAWVVAEDITRFVALAFGAGDHRLVTEDRAAPPPLLSGDRLSLGPLVAIIERLLGHPRLVRLRFLGERDAVLGGIARHGRPIQYAHVAESLALWDVWTRIAANPFAFEPPSAGFALDWGILGACRRRGVGFATLTHAAGLSSTGDPTLDLQLPFDEPFCIPVGTAAAVNRAKSEGRRIIAVGTTAVRALEASGAADGRLRTGHGVARGRLGRGSRLRIVNAILTGVHQAGESHFELLEAFAEEAALNLIAALAVARGYVTHEFGDSMLIEHQVGAPSQRGPCRAGRA
jgi:S-adenosylmethionine:tRNA ribosyltransferase-isomerase